ncbi:MBL fold metallo-hydrolase [Lachnospiraceae bacterium 47-T17]
MKIEQYMTPYMRSYCYVMTEGSDAIVVDPCEMDAIKRFLQIAGANISCCILTHEHYDHVSGLDWMHSLSVPVIASEACNEGLASPKINQSRYYDLFCMLQKRLADDVIPDVDEYSGYADRLFKNEMHFEWNGHDILLKETPGHSRGSICMLVDQKVLFSGDTLFADRDTNCTILGGNKKDLEEISMPWLLSLDKNLTVYPGHYDVFRLGDYVGGRKQ